MTCVAEKLFNVKSCGIPHINRGNSRSCTEHRVRDPGAKPFLNMSKSNRGPKPVNNRKEAQGALPKHCTVTFHLGDHGNVSIKESLRPLTSGFMAQDRASPANRDKECAFISFQAHPPKPPAVDFLAIAASCSSSPVRTGIFKKASWEHGNLEKPEE